MEASEGGREGEGEGARKRERERDRERERYYKGITKVLIKKTHTFSLTHTHKHEGVTDMHRVGVYLDILM
jgi:hypothetical protein